MKKHTTLTLIAAASALALSATAASAQMYDGRHVDRSGYGADYGNDRGRGYGAGVNQRMAQIDRRVDIGQRRGDLTTREAQMARLELARIDHLRDKFRSDGFDRWELATLDSRLDSLERQVWRDRHDNQYGYGYGRGHDYDRR